MNRRLFKPPTTYYDEKIKKIDSEICELIKKRKNISQNNPGYPPVKYIVEWSQKTGIYEDLLKSMFSVLWNENAYRPLVEPENFLRNIPVLKSIEIDNRLFSVVYIRQYSNSSVVDLNIDWGKNGDLSETHLRHTYFELYINKFYDCRMVDGTGGQGHYHYNFIVSPPLPDNLLGIDLTFKEYEGVYNENKLVNEIVIGL